MRLRKVFYLALFVVFFLWLHFWLRSWIIETESYTVICNHGWSLNIPLPKWFAPVIFGVSLLLIRQWWKETSLSLEWPWLLIISGGGSNFLERTRFGCITDYITLPFLPVFNIADVLLTIGTLCIIIRWSRNTIKN